MYADELQFTLGSRNIGPNGKIDLAIGSRVEKDEDAAFDLRMETLAAVVKDFQYPKTGFQEAVNSAPSPFSGLTLMASNLPEPKRKRQHFEAEEQVSEEYIGIVLVMVD